MDIASSFGIDDRRSVFQLFANAKLGEDDTQQIVRRKFSGDLTQSVLPQAQLLGQQIQRLILRGEVLTRNVQMRANLAQGMQMALARNESTTRRHLPTRRFQQRAPQTIQASAQLGG
jgi:hypothetical protein